MKLKILAIAIILALATLLVMPAYAADYNGINMEASQLYLRAGMNDTVTITIQMTQNGKPVSMENVPVVLNFLSSSDYMVFDKQLISTNSTGGGSTTVHINEYNEPERFKLQGKVINVQVEAVAEFTRASMLLYITGQGPINGYVINDDMTTITGALITIKGPDGKPLNYVENPVYSSNGTGSPMGYYRIDYLPLNVGKYTLTAEKGGKTGSILAEAGYESTRYDIRIKGYYDQVNVSEIVTSNQGNNTTVEETQPLPTPGESPAKPTSVTITIIVAIILIALVYIGLKAYRRMF